MSKALAVAATAIVGVVLFSLLAYNAILWWNNYTPKYEMSLSYCSQPQLDGVCRSQQFHTVNIVFNSYEKPSLFDCPCYNLYGVIFQNGSRCHDKVVYPQQITKFVAAEGYPNNFAPVSDSSPKEVC